MSYPPIVLDRVASLPLYRQIEVELRRAILDGRIGPGTVLPGIRSYARHLGVGRGDGDDGVRPADRRGLPRGEARAAGTRGGPGVSRPVPGPRRGPVPRARHPAHRHRPCRPSPGLRRPFFGGARSEPRFDFRTGSASLDLFPSAAWERLLPRAWRDLASDPAPATSYRYPEGDPRLRAELARVPRDGACGAGGPRPARDHGRRRRARSRPPIATVARGSGARWPSRTPGARTCSRTFAQAGVSLVHVPVDDRGLLVDRLPDGPGAVLVTPSWQYPGGGTMPVARRMQLLRWAAASDALVIEDDADAEPRYQGHAQPSLQGLDDTGRVLYVGLVQPGAVPGAADRVRGRAARVRRRVPRPAGGGVPRARAPSSSGRSRCSSPRATSSATSSGSGPTTRSARRRCSTRSPRSSGRWSRHARRPPARTSWCGSRTCTSRPRSSRRGRARSGVAVEPLSFSRHHPAGDQELLLHYARLAPDEIRAGVAVLARARRLEDARLGLSSRRKCARSAG